jgi:hypothetical protein
MTQLTTQILHQALQLPLEERELLAVELMTHLHQSGESLADVEAAWHAEIERRATQSDSSNDSVPFQEAWSRIAGKHG